MKRYTILLLLVILCSCGHSKPGYRAEILINQSANAKVEDLKEIKEILHSYPYEIVKIKEQENWKVESYKLTFPKLSEGSSKYSYVMFVIEAWFSVNSLDNTKSIDHIEIRVGNNWKGNEDKIRNEIETISGQILSLLSKKYEQSNYKVIKKNTSPM